MAYSISDDDLGAIVQDPDGGWLDQTPLEELSELAQRLLTAGEGWGAGQRSDLARAAATAGVRAHRRLFERFYLQAESMMVAQQEAYVNYMQALNRQVYILLAAGLTAESQQVHQVITAVGEEVVQRTESWGKAAEQQVLASVDEGLARIAGLVPPAVAPPPAPRSD